MYNENLCIPFLFYKILILNFLSEMKYFRLSST